MLGAEERTRMQDRQHSGEDRREATITECGQWEHIGGGEGQHDLSRGIRGEAS